MNAKFNKDQSGGSGVAEARIMASEFLAGALPDVHRVDIIKVVPATSGKAAWEAEAEVWQPNPALKSLGIEAGRPMLDHNLYLIRLDSMFNVLEYELAKVSEV